MRPSSRDKILRNLLASILSSDLSEHDLAELAESFITRDALVLEIGHILKDVNMRLSMFPRGGRLEPDVLFYNSNTPLSPLEVVSVIKSAGIPQAELLEIIGITQPEFAHFLSRKRLATTALVDRLFADTTPKDRKMILKNIVKFARSRIPTSDPYLDLITDKLNQTDARD